jgi:hypothetical protein
MGEGQVFWPEELKDANRQVQSYADKWRIDLSFKVGDFVYLKVSPMTGTRRFKVKGKLAPWYVGPVQIVDRNGEVAYQLELPPQLSDVHDVFHVSQLNKCLWIPVKSSRFAKYSGVTTLKMKLHGSVKKNSEQITQSFLPVLPNLKCQIPFKGGSFVTPTFLQQ